MKPPAETITHTLVDWTARQIHDPLLRLRFLRAVAPPVEVPKQGHNYRKIIWLSVVGLFVSVALLSLRLVSAEQPRVRPRGARAPLSEPIQPAPDMPSVVWLVEETGSVDTYSNGLRIENEYAVGNRPRSYMTFSLVDPEIDRGRPGTDPVGIVFHTTESMQAPFQPEQNSVLKRVGGSLLEYIRDKRAYNFVIDRFGRVFRVVREDQAADHAGHSIWADDSRVYINLNDSFLGVSFEARTGASGVNPAQFRAAAMLTEMLRCRYKIKAINCVTHAQVSVNPANMQVGYHTDWASSFPFERLGLPDNYARPLPSLYLFGFRYDSSFEEKAGARLGAAAELGERQLRRQAAVAGLDLAAYRKRLNAVYFRLAAVMNQPPARAETN